MPRSRRALAVQQHAAQRQNSERQPQHPVHLVDRRAPGLPSVFGWPVSSSGAVAAAARSRIDPVPSILTSKEGAVTS